MLWVLRLGLCCRQIPLRTAVAVPMLFEEGVPVTALPQVDWVGVLLACLAANCVWCP